jgi:hypothetical protein
LGKSKEQRAKGKEQRAKSKEQRAKELNQIGDPKTNRQLAIGNRK